MDLTKAEFRKYCLKKMSFTSKHNKLYRDKLVNQELISLFKSQKGLNVLLYWPLGLESDIRQALYMIRERNNVYLPFMEEISFKMVPFRLPLTRKKFGIFEAANSLKNIKKIDIAIIPAVGVDGKSRRIGFGKGMYDRFFDKSKKDPYKIFVQSQICYTEKNIGDDHDIMCDMLITPRMMLFHKKVKNANSRNNRALFDPHKRSSRFFHF
jgi:5-formyltetrahydrofolate cyclo-ligase